MSATLPGQLELLARLDAPRARSLRAVAADLVSLTKPRLSALVLLTAAGGGWLAGAPEALGFWVALLCGTAGVVGAANAFNCYLERDSDRWMARTARRPLPSGRLEPRAALVLGGLAAAGGFPALAAGTNGLTAALGALALATYVWVYTPLKRRSGWAVLAGAVPGALPPLMGWTAVTGRVELPGLALFAILFLWQVPHFLAIALFRKEEYRAAGLTNLALEKGEGAARALAAACLAALLPASAAPWALGIAGPGYLGAALALGAGFLWLGVRGWRRELGAAWARQLFFASLAHLTGLFLALGAAA